MARRKGRRPEYVIICREFNREMARIDISVIDSGVTDQLMKGLIMLHMRDPHKRYFLTNKTDYQKYGALMKKQIETMSIQNNKKIVELGGDNADGSGKMQSGISYGRMARLRMQHNRRGLYVSLSRQ